MLGSAKRNIDEGCTCRVPVCMKENYIGCMGITVRMKTIKNLFPLQRQFPCSKLSNTKKGGDKNKQKWIVKITLNCTVVKKRIRCVQNLYLKLKHGFCIQKRLYMHISDFYTVVNTCWRNRQYWLKLEYVSICTGESVGLEGEKL